MAKAKRKIATAKQAGDMKFDALAVDSKWLEASAWSSRSADEGMMLRIAVDILRRDDKQMKAGVSDDNVDALLDACDALSGWVKSYKSQIEMMEAASLRLLVALSHWEHRQQRKKAA